MRTYLVYIIVMFFDEIRKGQDVDAKQAKVKWVFLQRCGNGDARAGMWIAPNSRHR